MWDQWKGEINQSRWQLIKTLTYVVSIRASDRTSFLILIVYVYVCVFGVGMKQMFEDFFSTLSPLLLSVSTSSQLVVSFSRDLEHKLNISTLQCWKAHLKLVTTTPHPTPTCPAYHHLPLLCSCEDTEAPRAMKCLHMLEIESNGINQDTLFPPPFHSFLLCFSFLSAWCF